MRISRRRKTIEHFDLSQKSHFTGKFSINFQHTRIYVNRTHDNDTIILIWFYCLVLSLTVFRDSDPVKSKAYKKSKDVFRIAGVGA